MQALAYARSLRGRVLDLSPQQLDYLVTEVLKMRGQPVQMRQAGRQIEQQEPGTKAAA